MNLSLRQTFTRSINTVLTVVIVVVVFAHFGLIVNYKLLRRFIGRFIDGRLFLSLHRRALWLVWKGKEFKGKKSIEE